jgi:outer membrane receptor protein involved in Fe transport
MKTTVIFVLLGALAGIAVASLVVPPALSWYSTPGGLPEGAQIQALVEIPEVIRYSTAKLIRGQLIGAGIGSVIGLAAGIMVGRSGRRGPAALPVGTGSQTERPPSSQS